MLYWFLIIPLSCGIYLAIKVYNKPKLSELLIIALIPTIISFLSILFINYCYKRITLDKEYWGGYVTAIYHEEPWNEYVHMTCTRTVSCGKGCTTTENYDCSYVCYHPDDKYLIDSNHQKHHISDKFYLEICNKFKNETIVGKNRGYTISGRIFSAKFDSKEENIIPIVSEHYYDNPIQYSNNVINFQNISKKQAHQLKLYDYPLNGHVREIYSESILGKATQQEHRAIDLLNSKYGKELQLKIFFLLFDEDRSIFQNQLAYWKGGNKNELVICVGVDKNRNIKWSDVFSWSESEDLKVEIKNHLAYNIDKPLNIVNFSKWLEPKLNLWHRKSFKDFEYLNIYSPLRGMWIVLILQVAIIAGWTYIVLN